MFDTEKLERFLSVMMLFTALNLGCLVPVVGGAFGLLLAGDPTRSWPAILALTVVLAPVGLGVTLAVTWLLKRSRTGRAGPFLAAVAEEVEAEPSLGSLLWPLVTPRLVGEVDGHPFRLMLRRQAGILSAADPGRRFVVFGWMYELSMEAGRSGKAGFGPEGVPSLGLGLLGITGPSESRGGLATFACGTEEGERLVSDEAALEAARAMVEYGRSPALVRWTGGRIRVTGYMPDDDAPSSLVSFLRAAGALASRIDLLAEQA